MFKFSKSEAFSEAYFTCIFSSCGRDDWSKLIKRSWECGCCFLDPILVSAGLVSRLIEVSLDSVNPVLA